MAKNLVATLRPSLDNSVETSTPRDIDFHHGILDKTVQKHLVRKLDFIILPILAIIYFTHSLDRANLGNAKTDGFEADIGLKPNQYSLILVLFYIPYGTFNIPATILARRFNPAVVIPVLMLCWGAISLGSMAVHDFGGILAARILLGCVEAGFFPSAIFYLTMFYTRQEIAKRISLFYMMGFVANAYLFLIEGSLTIFLAILAFILLPRDVQHSRYFSKDEKECSKIRLAATSEEETGKFSWSATLKPLLQWQTWLYAAMALGYGVACASISNFLPTIIKRLTNDSIRANLFTIGPNLSGGLCIVLVCWISDRYQQRALCAIGATLVSMVGFIVLGTADLVHHTGAGYFCTFLLTFGTFTPAVVVPAWLSSNQISISGRATQLGLVAGMQNIAGIISSEAFRTQDAPVYAPALIVSACFQAFMILAATAAFVYYRSINRKLSRGEIVFVEGRECPPGFRFVL
ncbi:MFS general substrate transporter-42 [Coleophoma cylindrospora]|uniref:MFS general substrate transporter-42 n=1 Tax=Coleophoma cylindrospora TaxID=1849047 RepID=A0A3D8SSE6_9HELO|nr:MFS general substrate transporter-42 [Coleophoma cylindrospora]